MQEDRAYNLALAQLCERIFGARPVVSKLYSENNYVCRLDFEGTSKILKVAGGLHLAEAIRQENLALTRLRAAGLEVPAVEHEGTFRDLPYLVMEDLGPRDLASAITQRLHWAVPGCARAGQFLRRLHELPVSTVDGFVPQHAPVLTHLSWRHWTLVAAWEAAGDQQREALAAVEDRLNRSLQEPANAVVHDSFVATHVLTDGGAAFAVNDWETIGAGPPERDLACFSAALRTWMDGDPVHEEALLDGYNGGKPLESVTRERMADWRVYYLMNWAAFSARRGRGEMVDRLMHSIAQEVSSSG